LSAERHIFNHAKAENRLMAMMVRPGSRKEQDAGDCAKNSRFGKRRVEERLLKVAGEPVVSTEVLKTDASPFLPSVSPLISPSFSRPCARPSAKERRSGPSRLMLQNCRCL
jgi:hypothetical protein